jgi:hypothetical protein
MYLLSSHYFAAGFSSICPRFYCLLYAWLGIRETRVRPYVAAAAVITKFIIAILAAVANRSRLVYMVAATLAARELVLIYFHHLFFSHSHRRRWQI